MGWSLDKRSRKSMTRFAFLWLFITILLIYFFYNPKQDLESQLPIFEHLTTISSGLFLIVFFGLWSFLGSIFKRR